jgi:hypothetical protein
MVVEKMITATQAAGILIGLLQLIVWFRPRVLEYLLDPVTNKPTLGKVGQMTALLTSTWGFIALVELKSFSEWFFILYMIAWAGAQFGASYLKSKEQAVSK